MAYPRSYRGGYRRSYGRRSYGRPSYRRYSGYGRRAFGYGRRRMGSRYSASVEAAFQRGLRTGKRRALAARSPRRDR